MRHVHGPIIIIAFLSACGAPKGGGALSDAGVIAQPASVDLPRDPMPDATSDAGASGPQGSRARKTAGRQSIPQGRVGVAFSTPKATPVQELSVAEAVAIKDAVDAAYKRTYTEDTYEEWFFDAFDDEHLFFFVAQYQKSKKPGRPWGTYLVTRQYRVKRTPEAELALQVDRRIADYKVGLHGVRAGMTKDEVVAVLGEPLRVESLGPFDAFDYLYPRMRVRFLAHKVASFHEMPAEVAPQAPADASPKAH